MYTTQHSRYFTFYIILLTMTLVVANGPVHAAAAENTADEHQLIAVLQSDAPPQEKAITCKRLAVYGTKDAVPALGALLTDKDLSSWARIALEAIPDSAADQALREGLEKTNGRLLVGVINSIATRRDAEAVDELAGRLNDADTQIASAAAIALGRIGNAPSREALIQSLAVAPDDVRSAVAEGCILCAERLLADGDSTAAAQLYDKVRLANVPQQRILEGIRGAILARKSDGIPLLAEQLAAADKELFGIGLRTARELSGTEVTQALVTELGKAAADRQALLILAIAERDDDAVLPAILQASKNGENNVRIAAIQALERVGNVSCVPVLLETAIESNSELAQAAKETLANLPSQDVDKNLADRLPRADGKKRHVLIELVGLRRIDAVSDLIKAADDSDAQIRSAALAALGSTVGPGDLSVLITRVATPTNSADTEAARKALRTACIRMPDRDVCAAQLAAAMPRASVEAKKAILETIASVGGAKALQSLASAAEDKNPELQDAATRLLGEWMTTDAAPVLLNLAQDSGENKYKIRALRGYIRIARQFNFPAEQRAEMCRAALEAAQRDNERNLVLQVLARYPSVETLALAVDTAKIPSLKNAATKASIEIAQKIGGSGIDVKELLAQAGIGPLKIEIIKAEYGAGAKVKDVTEAVRKNVGKLPLVVLPASYNASFGGDPAPGVPKQLKVKYKINNETGEASFQENEAILLPMPESR